jgi:hypothetical protein
MELVGIVLKLVDLFQPTDTSVYEEGETWFWALENPLGRLPSLFPEIGQSMYFQPWMYAGHIGLSDADHNELDRLRRKDGIGISAEENQFIIDRNAYTKRTGIWGNYNRELVKSPVEPVKGTEYGSPLLRFGGTKSETKEIRSNTPLGFALAFYEANKDWSPKDNPEVESFTNFKKVYKSLFTKKTASLEWEKRMLVKSYVEPYSSPDK